VGQVAIEYALLRDQLRHMIGLFNDQTQRGVFLMNAIFKQWLLDEARAFQKIRKEGIGRGLLQWTLLVVSWANG
jgi:hypothetical protein